jgi:hypothetical protein
MHVSEVFDFHKAITEYLQTYFESEEFKQMVLEAFIKQLKELVREGK